MSNLTRPRTRTLGRADDLARVEELFSSGASLVTLWGPGGVGKTRLAREWGASRAQWFCDLSEARSVEAITSRVAGLIGVSLTAARTEFEATTALARALAARPPTTFILDNCEQCVAEIASALGIWLDAAEHVRFLVTSREPLRIEGEHGHEVRPLSTRDLACDAVQLFMDRAAARGRSSRWENDAPVVLEIVRRLDGLPLAIELAASRLDVLSPKAMLSRLSDALDALDTLESAQRDLPSRHATMRATLDSSWALLSPEKRAALAQCAVFRGSFGLDAFDAVVQLTPPVSSLDVLQGLRSASLVSAVEAAPGDEEPRFALLQTVRDYAEERLRQSGDEAAVRARHAEYYVRELEAGHASSPMALDNVLAAFERATVPGLKLRIVAALDRHILEQGPLPSHHRMLDEVLGDESAAGAFPALHVRALLIRNRARFVGGRIAGLRPDVELALRLAERIGDPQLLARALCGFAQLEIAEGNLAEAEALTLRAVSVSRAANDRAGLAAALNLAPHVYIRLGRTDEAERHCREATELFRDDGDLALASRALGTLGWLLAHLGRPHEAKHYLEEAIARLRMAGDMRTCAVNIGLLGALHRELGDCARGRSILAEALSILEACGARHVYGALIGFMGLLHHEEGNALEACRCYEEARHVILESGNRVDGLQFAGPLAAGYAATGRHELAAQVLEDARVPAAKLGNASLDRSLELYSALVDVARGSLARAREQLAASAATSTAEVRAARRLLERAVLNAETAAPAGACAREPGRVRLGLAANGEWFRVADGERVDLRKRRPLRLVLLALAKHRARGNAEPFTLEQIIAEGWPDERIMPEAAAARAYVTINRLRDLGLREVLSRRDDGYALDARIDVAFEP